MNRHARDICTRRLNGLVFRAGYGWARNDCCAASRYRRNSDLIRFRRNGKRCIRIANAEIIPKHARHALEYATDDPSAASRWKERQVHTRDAHSGCVAALDGRISWLDEVLWAKTTGEPALSESTGSDRNNQPWVLRILSLPRLQNFLPRLPRHPLRPLPLPQFPSSRIPKSEL